MSDVKRWTIEGVCFNDGTFEPADESTKGIPPNAVLSFVLASDHDRIVAELNKELRRTIDLSNNVANEREQTIATQKRVIEIAKYALEYCGLRPPDGGDVTLELVLEDTRAALKKIEAIGRGEK